METLERALIVKEDVKTEEEKQRIEIENIYSINTYYRNETPQEMEIRLKFVGMEEGCEVIFQNWGCDGWLIDEIFLNGTERQKQIYLNSKEEYKELVKQLHQQKQIKNIIKGL